MKAIALASLAVVMIAGTAQAQEHPQQEHPRPAEAAAEVIEATVTGENICVGCSLQALFGAASQCSVYGHRHALKVTAASAGEEELEELKGWVLHYLPNEKGQPFIDGHHKETLKLTGKVYVEARVLEVQKQEKTEEPERLR